MTRFRIYPYKNGSRSARALREAIPNCMEIRREGSRYAPRQDDVIINWGASDCPVYGRGMVLNQSIHISDATNKLNFFMTATAHGRGGLIPQYWNDSNDIPDDAFPVVCRTVLNGHSGRGIVVANNREQLVNAPLYTKYIKKQDEYRVHVGRRPNGEAYVFSLQRKARRTDVENPNWQVRNHQNGFVYIRDGINPPACVEYSAISVFNNFNLAFGAVDVIYNRLQDRAYVLEINTAPGCEGETVEHYRRYFEENY